MWTWPNGVLTEVNVMGPSDLSDSSEFSLLRFELTLAYLIILINFGLYLPSLYPLKVVRLSLT